MKKSVGVNSKIQTKYPNIHSDEQYSALKKQLTRRVLFYIYLSLFFVFLAAFCLSLAQSQGVLGGVFLVLSVGAIGCGEALNYDPSIIVRAKMLATNNTLTKKEIETAINKDNCKILLPFGTADVLLIIFSVYLLMQNAHGILLVVAVFIFAVSLVVGVYISRFSKQKRLLKNNCFEIYKSTLVHKGKEDSGSVDSPSYSWVMEFENKKTNKTFSYRPTSKHFHMAEIGEAYFIVVFERNEVIMALKETEWEIDPEIALFLQG